MHTEKQTEPARGKALGWHWLVDFYGCSLLPTDPAVLEAILVFAAESAGATVVQSCFHQFSPFGLTGVVVIAESHLSAHTWPEHNAMCLDLFSCSEKIQAEIAIEIVSKKIGAGSIQKRKIERGIMLD